MKTKRQGIDTFSLKNGVLSRDSTAPTIRPGAVASDLAAAPGSFFILIYKLEFNVHSYIVLFHQKSIFVLLYVDILYTPQQ